MSDGQGLPQILVCLWLGLPKTAFCFALSSKFGVRKLQQQRPRTKDTKNPEKGSLQPIFQFVQAAVPTQTLCAGWRTDLPYKIAQFTIRVALLQ